MGTVRSAMLIFDMGIGLHGLQLYVHLLWPIQIRGGTGVSRLIWAGKSVSSDRDPTSETTCDIVLYFCVSIFMKPGRDPIVEADLC
jgi:hypothetical protein